MKILIYYGTDGDAAKAMASQLRSGKHHVQVRHSVAFDGIKEPAEKVIMTSCVVAWAAEKIVEAYGDICEQIDAPKVAGPVVDTSQMKIGKGPRGKWFLRDGKKLVSGPYETEAEARDALGG